MKMKSHTAFRTKSIIQLDLNIRMGIVMITLQHECLALPGSQGGSTTFCGHGYLILWGQDRETQEPQDLWWHRVPGGGGVCTRKRDKQMKARQWRFSVGRPGLRVYCSAIDHFPNDFIKIRN